MHEALDRGSWRTPTLVVLAGTGSAEGKDAPGPYEATYGGVSYGS